jgi:hypothetical protein
MSVPGWQPGTQYNYGDIVEFECIMLLNLDDSHSLTVVPRCQIQNNPAPQVSGNPAPCTIQSDHHRLILLLSITQGDWTPPVTPALWGRIPDDKWDDHAPYNPPHDKGTAIDRLSLPSIDF